jgi:hypothetical protein
VSSTIFHPKNAWWSPNIFKNFPSKKCLAITRHFLPFFIQKMLDGHQVFSRTSDPENAEQPLGVF